MDQILEKLRSRRAPTDILAVDIGTSGTKLVRMKLVKDSYTVSGAELLESDASASEEAAVEIPPPVSKALKTKFSALSFSGDRSVIRLLSVREHGAADMPEARLRELMGLNPSYRISSTLAGVNRSKGESKLLAVGIPDEDLASLMALFKGASPAPVSLEVSTLASLSAFMKGPVAKHPEQAIALIEGGAEVTQLSIFNKGSLSMVRKFGLGANMIANKVRDSLKVEIDVARQIVADGSFDISNAVKSEIHPFLRQLSISMEFVERHENCKLSALYLSGGLSLSSFWVNELKDTVGVDLRTWNPFDDVAVQQGAVSAEILKHGPRFSGAIGAAIGALEKRDAD